MWIGAYGDRDPAGRIWVFLGARGSGDGAGSVEYWQEGQFRGVGSSDRQYGEELELGVPALGLGVCTLSNKQLYHTKS